jgi:hypothetical protein
MWRLSATPGSSVAFLRERLLPVARPERKTIERLIADLDSPAYLARQRATQELSTLDRSAEPALRKVLASGS